MFILASHGDYALETLRSCEMITGNLSDFATVSFKDPMSVDDVVSSYDKIYQENTPLSKVTIIVDIPNGTPANAAKMFISKHPEVHLYSGLSLMLVLSLATGTTINEAIQEAKALTGSTAAAKSFVSKSDPQKKNNPKNSVNPLINVRIDSRLIHGQVATMWTRSLNVTRIMVVDNQIVKSGVQKTTLKTAVPAGVHLSILTADGAARRINSGQYNGQRVFLLVKNPQVIDELISKNVKIAAVNVGNISMSAGARQVAKSVAVTKADVKTFEKLAKKGLNFYHQMVPNDKQENFMQMLEEKEN